MTTGRPSRRLTTKSCGGTMKERLRRMLIAGLATVAASTAFVPASVAAVQATTVKPAGARPISGSELVDPTCDPAGNAEGFRNYEHQVSLNADPTGRTLAAAWTQDADDATAVA